MIYNMLCDLPETASALKAEKVTFASTQTIKGTNSHLLKHFG